MIVVWSVTALDIHLGKKLVRLGDFKIRHEAFSQNCVYLFALHTCLSQLSLQWIHCTKLSASPSMSGDAGRSRLGETSLPAL